MLSFRQTVILCTSAFLFWAAATALIRFMPSAVADPLRGDLGYLLAIPVCWLCILVVRRSAGLRRQQLVSGTALVIAVAALIDAVALRWMPFLYGTDEQVLRLGAAWLLWGYGVTLLLAFAACIRADVPALIESRI